MIPEIASARPLLVSAFADDRFPLFGPLRSLSILLNAKSLLRSPSLPLREARIPKQGALAP